MHWKVSVLKSFNNRTWKLHKIVNFLFFIFQILHKYDSFNSIRAISSDGCAVNTGHTNGAIRLTEVAIGRPLSWFICLLHFNELIFRKLFTEIGKYFCKICNNITPKHGTDINGCEQMLQLPLQLVSSQTAFSVSFKSPSYRPISIRDCLSQGPPKKAQHKT